MATLLKKLLTEKNIPMLNFNPENYKSQFNLIFLGLFLLVCLSLMNGFFNTWSNNDSEYLKKEFQNLKSEIQSYKDENKKLTEKLVEYEKILVKIDTNISRNNKKIDILKSSTNEKINSFKSYDAVMWEKFFADRYKK